MNTSFLIIFCSLLAFITGCKPQTQKITYPEAKRSDVTDVYFGVEVADPYRWLEDPNSAETAEWVIAQNNLTNAHLDAIPFRSALRSRFEAIWNFPRYGVPFKKGNRYFFFKNDGLQNQSVLYMQEDLDAQAEILLDPNKFAADGTIALGDVSPSPDGNYLAFSISRGGSDWNEILIMEIASRKIFPDTIKWVKFSDISWQGNGFYYSAFDAPLPGEALSGKNIFHKVYYHKLGTSQSADQIIFQDKKNPKRNFFTSVTSDERFLMISEAETTSGNALYVKDSYAKNPEFVKIAEGFNYDHTPIDHIDGKVLVFTNNQAPMGKLVLIDPANPAPENWQVVIPEKENVLQNVDMAGNLIFAEYLEDANSKGYFYDYTGSIVSELQLPGIGSITGFRGEKGVDLTFFGFTSFTFPSSVYKYDISTHELVVYRESEVDFNPYDYETRQVFFPSKDGTEIPMFIVHKKGLRLNGRNPVLMYGYGGFNASVTPSFSVARIPFLEQGGIYVSVNLRGGGEYGHSWHKAGTKMNKQNVFDDFISAAEFLIRENYTNPNKIAIIGVSNGGLLVGASMVQRPDLFRVAIPLVGVLDMLRYQNFTIGWAWAIDYGRSDDSEEMFRYLLGYSPLHNVKETVSYPVTLAITADHDDRVVPAHTYKFIAELQFKQTGPNPVLVRIETKAGHGAGKPTSKLIDENTDIYSFIMYHLGMNPVF